MPVGREKENGGLDNRLAEEAGAFKTYASPQAQRGGNWRERRGGAKQEVLNV